MLRFIARRLAETIPVLLIVSVFTFVMMRIAPGGPFDKEKATTPEIRAALEKAYGLDRPWVAQYGTYMKQLATGELLSYKYANRTVYELIHDSFPASLELGCLSLVIALALGLTAGLIAAIRQNTALAFTCNGSIPPAGISPGIVCCRR
jgi:oligopeptide transport system permease protein